jgi:hypothetical protein
VLDELEALFETDLDKFLCGSKVVALGAAQNKTRNNPRLGIVAE